MKEDKMVLIFIVWAVAVCVSTCVFLHNPTTFTLQGMEITLLSGLVFVAFYSLIIMMKSGFKGEN